MNEDSMQKEWEGQMSFVPRFRTVWILLSLLRILSAVTNGISDCDETFNYWEPLHFLIHSNQGFQTWEYSPAYALRSYVYLDLHRALGSTVLFLISTVYEIVEPVKKISFFYALRIGLGITSAAAEAFFVRAIRDAFGPRLAWLTFGFLATSPGMFVASTSFLPSSFTMSLLMLIYASWLNTKKNQNRTQDLVWGIALGIVSVLSGWVYVGALYVVYAVDMLARFGWLVPTLVGILLGTFVLIFEIMWNWMYYDTVTCPCWNIFHYNVLSSTTSSELYGTEPWWFYLLNGVLNFNLAFVLALVSGIGLLIFHLVFPLEEHQNRRNFHQLWMYLLPMYLWLAILMNQAHKEERFMSPVYPLLCLAAATSLSLVLDVMNVLIGNWGKRWIRVVHWGFWILVVLCSCARVMALTTYYHTPITTLWTQLFDLVEHREEVTTICLEKEWYRFPSHFFVPTSARVEFLRSDFRGQLPQHFNATSSRPGHFNDQNQEEMSQYVSIESCDIVVDLVLPHDPKKSWTTDDDKWHQTFSVPFLDAAQSHRFFRAFYVPYVSPKFVRFQPYAVFERRRNLNSH